MYTFICTKQNTTSLISLWETLHSKNLTSNTFIYNWNNDKGRMGCPYGFWYVILFLLSATPLPYYIHSSPSLSHTWLRCLGLAFNIHPRGMRAPNIVSHSLLAPFRRSRWVFEFLSKQNSGFLFKCHFFVCSHHTEEDQQQNIIPKAI